MPTYSYYNPAQGAQQRQAGNERLMMILDQRRQDALAKAEMAKLEAESQKQLDAERQGAWDGMGSMFGSAAQGAAVGTMFSPGMGTAIGAGAGLLVGGLTEMKQRKDFKKATGEGDYGWGDAFGDTVGRAPNMSEFTSMLGSGAQIGAGIAGAQARKSSAMGESAAYGNALAEQKRFETYGTGDLNAATGPYAPTPQPTAQQNYIASSGIQPPQPPLELNPDKARGGRYGGGGMSSPPMFQ